MSEARGRPQVYSIPPHRSFVDSLVAQLMARHSGDPLALARGRILVPTNRAARSLRDAFVRAGGAGLLLPRLVPIGDSDLGDRLGLAFDPVEADPPPPAIDARERSFMLAHILLGRAGQSGERAGLVSALRQGDDLARTLDQLTIEQVRPTDLKALAAESVELSAHWQFMLQQLSVIFDAWPGLLEERGAIDLAERRHRLLMALADRWKRSPPPGLTIAAGITTTAPGVAALLGVIARMEGGQVVLPALAKEREMPAAEWDALRPDENRAPGISTLAHPQYHLRLLLDRMGVGRGEVQDWHRRGIAAAEAERSRAVINAMTAAPFTAKWRDLDTRDRSLGPRVTAAEFDGPADEAMGIAIALRGALEEPEKTAALVTPDRGLAQRVSAILRRWNIEAEDTAGVPLALSAPGRLALQILDAVETDFAPVETVSLIKHPLVGGTGTERGGWLSAARTIDQALRGARPPAGLDGIERAIEGLYSESLVKKAREAFGVIRPPLDALRDIFAGPQSLADLGATLRLALDAMAGERAWTGSAGGELAQFVEILEGSAAAGDLRVEPDERRAVIAELMQGRSVRAPYGGHPRVQILGLLEARLLQADFMVLGGLNEGSWPGVQDGDPWLAPRIRRELGLPGLDYNAGLAAHDFMSALGAPRVLLTRAKRDARAPTIASRFWLRLDAMTGGVTRDDVLVDMARAIDRPSSFAPVQRPSPRVPRKFRPATVPVTGIEKLRADPYYFYAHRILRLRAFDPLDSQQLAAWQGSKVHDLFQLWLEEDECAPEALAPRLDAMLSDGSVHPMLRALWGARLRENLDFMIEEVGKDRAAGREPVKAELKGTATLHGVTIDGRADRIDRLQDGSIGIVDYKTGSSPSRKMVDGDYAIQLGLLGLIARAGGFENFSNRPAALEYWKLTKVGGKFGQRMPATKDDEADYLDRVDGVLKDLIATYWTDDAQFRAEPNPPLASYGTYDQLMRLEEWYGREL